MHRSRFEIVLREAGIDDSWDAHDQWGTAIGLFFDVAEVLNMSDIEGDVTPSLFARWDYRPSPYVTIPAIETVAERAENFSEGEFADDYSYNVVMLASALHNEQITQDDLIYLGNVLDKFTDLLRSAGKDY